MLAVSLALSVSFLVATDDEDLSLQVQRIFLEKCGACHGSQLEKPDGDFGFLDDLRAVAADDFYIVRGDPEDSILFESISLDPDDPDFMPPADADELPLTAEELDVVRRWIEAGAEVSDEAQALKGSLGPRARAVESEEAGDEAATGVVTPTPKKKEKERTLAERWRRFVGQFHTASTHLPIGLILAAALAEILSTIGHRRQLRYVARFCLLIGFLGAVFAATSGWWKAEGSYGFRGFFDPPGVLFETTESGRPVRGNEIYWHRWLGVICAGACLIGWILALLTERLCHAEDGSTRRRGFLFAYRLWLLMLAGLTGVVGFLGGKLVHGASGAYEWL